MSLEGCREVAFFQLRELGVDIKGVVIAIRSEHGTKRGVICSDRSYDTYGTSGREYKHLDYISEKGSSGDEIDSIASWFSNVGKTIFVVSREKGKDMQFARPIDFEPKYLEDVTKLFQKRRWDFF
jgi:hypothetical protein